LLVIRRRRRGPQTVRCDPDHAGIPKRLEDLDEACALGDVPNRLCLRPAQHPRNTNVAHGARLGVQPKGVIGPDDPLREPVVGEVEDPRRCRGSGRDEVQLRRTGLARRCDPKPVIVVGEDRVPDFGDPQPLEDIARRRRDALEVDTARVVPFVEPEVAAAVDPCRRRVGPSKGWEGHHDGAERVPRGVRDDVGDTHDRALVHQDSRGVLVDGEHRQYLSTSSAGSPQLPERSSSNTTKTGRPKRNSRCR
jgi:hypothetical protein